MAAFDDGQAAGAGAGAAPRYPVPELDKDLRFSFGLIYEVGKVLESYGFPPVTYGCDHVNLGMALFGFLYRPVPAAACQATPDPSSHALIPEGGQ